MLPVLINRISISFEALLKKMLFLILLFYFSAFVSLLTPQLREDCSEFHITEDQESWIGKSRTKMLCFFFRNSFKKLHFFVFCTLLQITITAYFNNKII